MPGASANGRFAYRPITSVAITDASAVAVNTAPKSMPVADSMPGFTAISVPLRPRPTLLFYVLTEVYPVHSNAFNTL
ncbi:hypothetical protein ADUPG1_004611, partial [Aduncisulcus paluster]